ncbi:MAG: HAD-IC family P-type ATPase, partial [Eubacterium sp.]|nr:HAD-IC family P-type ATPase [Eubacterium sp.]
SIAECHTAGIKTVMITGDHKNTAVAIAKDLHIYGEDSLALSGVELNAMSDADLEEKIDRVAVYARVSPEHKVRIVDAWQKRGAVVAMTGDGVNDAPALKKADIGCAMGITGTDVSKEAAEMILTDDNFSTIVSAVKEGRGIYDNIKKAVHFLLSCNIAEILILFVATLVGWVQPLLPVHILWINLITDSLPALALGLEKGDDDIMKKSPRSPKESFFARGLGGRIVFQGIVLSLLSLGVFHYGYTHFGVAEGRTMVFAVLGLSQLTHVLNVRSEEKSVFGKQFFTNRYLWGAILISMVLQLSVILIPAAHSIFSVTFLDLQEWLIIIAASLAPLLIVEITKLIGRVLHRTEK